MRLSVILPYCYGGDELRLTALANTFESIRGQEVKDYELIVVEQLVKATKPTFPYIGRVDQFITLKDPQNRWYNKSWCMNVGARKARTDKLLFLDADVLFGKEYFDKILDYANHYAFFYGYNWIALMPGRDNPLIRVKPHKDLHAAGASWFSTKQFFWDRLTGCNENYFGYGSEDQDIHLRAKYILGSIPELDYPIVHQYHHWASEEGGANPWVNKDGGITFGTLRMAPDIIVDRLKLATLGQLNEPTLIDGSLPRNFRESNLQWRNIEMARKFFAEKNNRP